MKLRHVSILGLFAALQAVGALGDQDADLNGVDKRKSSSSGKPLRNFQVHEPVLTPRGPDDPNGCIVTKTLMLHDFASSYGHPFVGEYTPPDCSFNRVTMNLTVTSRGRQYDRLGVMYLGDTEVFRTSTAEPTTDGIVWTYVKEMQQYNTLWREQQKVIFDLGNIVDETYTGVYHTELTATFFTVSGSPKSADEILPISKRLGSSGQPSVFTIPSEKAVVSYRFPANVERAAVSLSACGQAAEEFWYTNVLDSEMLTFNSSTGPLNGGGPFREVQLLIDGHIAGVSWPFPVIFTGGIVPGFWRPIAGIDAFDLREHEIDVTPWLDYLLDGKPHSFEIQVASVGDDGKGSARLNSQPGSNWPVTGKIFLFKGQASRKGSGKLPAMSVPKISLSVSSKVTVNDKGENETLTYTTNARRQLKISSTFDTKKVSWIQDLAYENYNAFSGQGLIQYTRQSTGGSDRSLHSGYFTSYNYPLSVNSSYSVTSDGAVSIYGKLSRGLNLGVLGPSVFPSGVQSFNSTQNSTLPPLTSQQDPEHMSVPLGYQKSYAGSILNTTQEGVAGYNSSPGNKNSTGYGSTTQKFTFKGIQSSNKRPTELYSRSVKAVNSTIIYDHQSFAGKGFDGQSSGTAPNQAVIGGYIDIRKTLGRGKDQVSDI